MLGVTACDNKPVAAPQAPKPPQAPPSPAAPPSVDMSPLSREILFHAPVQYQGRISPNGRKVSWLSRTGDVLNLFIADSNDPGSAKQVTFSKLGIGIHYWTPNSAFILFTEKTDERLIRTWSLNVNSLEQIALGPDLDGVGVRLEKVSPNWPEIALVSINDRDPNWYDLYRINLRTGQRTLVMKNTRFKTWVADDDLAPRIGIQMNEDHSKDWFLLLPGGGEKLLFRVEADAVEDTFALTFDPSGTVLYMMDKRQQDYRVFIALDLLNGTREVLAEAPGFPVDRVFFHPVTRQPVAWVINAVLPEWFAFTADFAPTLELARSELGPNFHILATTSDMSKLVLYSDQSDRPGKYSLLDRNTEEVSTMFETAPAQLFRQASKTRPVKIAARDGFHLIGYLSPATITQDSGPSPAPLVLIPQPWPGSRMFYGYDPTLQWLNSRGISVLEINTRGASDLGLAYDRMGKGKYLQRAANDMIDAANAAISNEWALPHQISVIGTGLGGSTTLDALSDLENPFSCAITLNAITDLRGAMAWFKTNNPSMAKTIARDLSGPDGTLNRALIEQLSPDHQETAPVIPLLMVQTSLNPKIALPGVIDYAQSIADRHTPVTLVTIDGKFDSWYDNMVVPPAFAVMEQFLNKCIGSTAEPIGNALQDMKVDVPVGADEFPELISALQTQP